MGEVGGGQPANSVPQGNVLGNVERFSGFANLYDSHRPGAPATAVELITIYCCKRPSLVVDLGCGTGLSTLVWWRRADRVIGVEPNEDMLSIAQAKLGRLLLSDQPASSTGKPVLATIQPRRAGGGASSPGEEAGEEGSRRSEISFARGFSNQIPIPDAAADVVTCSQSFHWMEPESTLAEVARVLRDGGVFAAYDCDWPPTIDWVAEDAYDQLLSRVRQVATALPEGLDRSQRWDKGGHLRSIVASGRFRFAREVVFHSTEECDADRFIGIALSQGELQLLLRLVPDQITPYVEAFERAVGQRLGKGSRKIVFGYRMRLGVK